MDFVTITDHDTIAGVARDRRPCPTCSSPRSSRRWFRGEPQAVHILCWGITPGRPRLAAGARGRRRGGGRVPARQRIACALAHPFYAVAAPLTARHRRRLARLFPVWETRNGSRARELNMPAAIYIETHGGAGVGGSDDHAGVDIGRTWTETPPASTPEEFLRRLRARRRASPAASRAAPPSGRTPRWRWPSARSAAATAARPPDPRAVLRDGRAGDEPGRRALRRDRAPISARTTRARCCAPGSTRSGSRPREPELLAWMQEDGFATPTSSAARVPRARAQAARRGRAGDRGAPASADAGCARAAEAVFSACIPAIPYAPAAAFLGREKSKLLAREQEPLRVALVADGVGGMHGVTHTLDEIRERGVPGFEVEVIGTDPNVDRRLPAVAEVDIPFYAGLQVGVPSLPRGRRGARRGALRHRAPLLPRPGRGRRRAHRPDHGRAAGRLLPHGARRLRRAALRRRAAAGGDGHGAGRALRPVRRSSSRRARRPTSRCGALGVAAEQIGRWDRGVDLAPLRPERCATPGSLPGELTVLYAGRLTTREGRRPARRRVPRRARARPAPASRAGRWRPRGGARCASGSASTRRSSAGSRARSSRAPTRARTSSCSPAAPTPSARSCSRRRRAGCRWSPSPRAGRCR